MGDDYFSLNIWTKEVLADLFFPKSLFSFFASSNLYRQLVSIFQVPKDGCSNVFASILTVFSTTSSQESSSRLGTSN